MHALSHRVRDERGSVLVIALLATVVMLGFGMALLSVVDTQAGETKVDRTRDRGFNLAESVLTSETFVLGRRWPTAGGPTCSAANAGFSDTIPGTAGTPTPEVAGVRDKIEAAYGPDAAYNGASWQVNVCDDGPSDPRAWSSALLSEEAYDADGDDRLWVRAQARVGGRTRVVTGLVQVVSSPALPARYGLVSGGLTDDLGATVNNLGSNALGGTLGQLLVTTPTVAPEMGVPDSGVTGLRCGLLDMQANLSSTCVAGTIGALAAVPVVAGLLTGGKLEQFPSPMTAGEDDIGQMRRQAQASGTLVASSPGGAYATAPACATSGTPSASTVVFIERVGTGNEWCYINVGGTGGLEYKALVVGSGRVILRGDGSRMLPQTGSKNTYTGIVYALNRQRLDAPDGLGLGDDPSPGREVVRIENGAHVIGGVYADGGSAKVGIYPPPLQLSTNTLVDGLIPCVTVLFVTNCTLRNLVKALTGGVSAIVDRLIELTSRAVVVSAILNQLNPQRAEYGSAITSNRAVVNRLTVYGDSGIVGGSFKDLGGRTS